MLTVKIKDIPAIQAIDIIKNIDKIVDAFDLMSLKKAAINNIGYLSKQDLMYINNVCVLKDIDKLIESSGIELKLAVEIIKSERRHLHGY